MILRSSARPIPARCARTARNKLFDLEHLTEDELERVKSRFTRLTGCGETLLQDASDDLTVAGKGLRQAKKKVEAFTRMNPRESMNTDRLVDGF